MRGARSAAAQSGWRQVELTLEKLLARGMLTMADVQRVQETFDELYPKVKSGEITEHFFGVVMRKMAESMVASYRERNGMHL